MEGKMTEALGRRGVGFRVDVHQLYAWFAQSVAVIPHPPTPVRLPPSPPTVNKDDLGSQVLWGFTHQAC